MKLMIKIFIVMASAVAFLFYFMSGQDISGGKGNEKGEANAGLKKLADLPGGVAESSGIEVLPQKGQYITLNDAGNKPELYQLDEKGKLVKTYRLKIPNVDWEDLTRDNSGNLYIADTGNNDNDRKELAVYKVHTDNLSKAEAIRFSYEDQKEFPPSKKERNFDSEAIFWNNGYLYVITKDRGQKETAKVYQIPDKPGNYKAKLMGKAKLNGEVTGAAISPDGKLVVLLEDEKMHIYRNFNEPAAFHEGEADKVELSGAGQTEAVAFEDEETLIITSEGGALYRYGL